EGEPGVDRGELGLELAHRPGLLAVGADHRPGGALLLDESLEGGELGLQRADARAVRRVDRALLDELAAQRLRPLLLRRELAGNGGAAGALVDPERGGALVAQLRLLAVEREEALLLALLLGAARGERIGQRLDILGLEVGDLRRLLLDRLGEARNLRLEELHRLAGTAG